MKFISITGSSCSGKSAVIACILKRREKLFHLSYDSIKWSFSKYSPDTHVNDVHKVMLSIAKTVFALQYDVISETGLRHEWRETILSAARASGYEITEVVLEADYAVLEKRFEERVAYARANPEAHISNLSKERFREIFEIFERDKNPAATSFRTDSESVERISESILKLF